MNNIREYILEATYRSGPHDDRFGGYREYILMQWNYEIDFVIVIRENGTRVAERTFRIRFTDRELNDEDAMLRIIHEHLSRTNMQLSVYIPKQHIYYEDVAKTIECEWVERNIITPEALKVLEYLKTLVPNNTKLIDGYLLPQP